MKYSFFSLILLSVFVLSGCTIVPLSRTNTSTRPLDKSVDVFGDNGNLWEELKGLTFTDLEGDIVTLAQFEATPVVINSWASSCIFCTKEIPDIVSVQKEFAEKVQFVLINRSEDTDHVRDFLAAHDPANALYHFQDEGDLFYSIIGGFAMPETLFIKPNGTILLHNRGPMIADEIRTQVTLLLE